jgi:WD40 repeat protein
MSLVYGKHPHHKTIDAILQFLKDQGLDDSFRSLVNESHHEYAPEHLPDHCLMKAMHYYLDLAKVQQQDDDDQVRKCAEKALLDLQEFRETIRIPVRVSRDFRDLHKGNVICVRFGPDGVWNEAFGDVWAVTGSVDRAIAFLDVDRDKVVVRVENVASSAILSADFNPVDKELLAISSMDGHVYVLNWVRLVTRHQAGELDLDDERVRCKIHDHGSKYVMNVKWSIDGKFIASCSSDHTVNVYKIENSKSIRAQKIANLLFRETPECIAWTEVTI